VPICERCDVKCTAGGGHALVMLAQTVMGLSLRFEARPSSSMMIYQCLQREGNAHKTLRRPPEFCDVSPRFVTPRNGYYGT